MFLKKSLKRGVHCQKKKTFFGLAKVLSVIKMAAPPSPAPPKPTQAYFRNEAPRVLDSMESNIIICWNIMLDKNYMRIGF